ncbi:auxin-responsive protein SAUR71-like protein [Cinnamomum micranthum f. kanehirae]|uniref:Auxin-responsive protein SAUR71-like protein n=1 Tax=Cinnamomum micranthum f. kanehirae TaxID=337451 RepID=A0A443N9M2_9MAGN|nr:auxin-responsive protein SAUR71-like protein [Cinnamomum micranthum f. kanehirae]
MATAMKKVDKIRQIVHLKQLAKRWKAISLLRRPVFSHPDSDSDSNPPRRITSGFFAVYVGAEQIRFVIPTRFLSLPIFVALLNKAEEEYGFQARGGLVLPCEVGFFKGVLRILEEDEQRFRGWELDDVLQLFAEVGLDSSCKDGIGNGNTTTTTSSCHAFTTPLLPKARV